MLIGAMNHPQKEVLEEIHWMAAMGLDFIDLTLEPPAAAAWSVDARTIRAVLEDQGLRAVGHTAYYLPIGSPFEAVRRAAVIELRRCMDVFRDIGVKWMNVHPDRYAPMHDRAFSIQQDLASLRELLSESSSSGVGIMLENLPGDFNTPAQIGELLDPLPDLGLHLDIGHANLITTQNTTSAMLQAYGHRLRHVHLHDNKGGSSDLHLPLGAGTLDVQAHLQSLKSAGYDGTITLEVFTPDSRYLAMSRDRLREWWDAI